MNKEFIDQDRWDQSYEQLQLSIAPPDDPIRKWVEKFTPPAGGSGSCLELGCFPGRYLAVFAELGFEVHGLDRTPRITPDLRDWMHQQGYAVGEFICGNVFQHAFSRQYDVVCSFGLIEHFSNWAELLEIHARLVTPGGTLIVSAPNFRGFYQRKLHEWFDPVNLAEHNLDAMHPKRWADTIRPLGFAVEMCGYIGPYDFWVGAQPRAAWQVLAIKVLRRLKLLGRCLPDNVGFYAPYCGLVARRRSGRPLT
ncbi:MAG TPA: class I SAM-dependent methyltransferase [Verrucomicrobiae bacterium]|nr:class I SAM-dependent methyltransferase [Verrucomicrobiae bacterium]